MDNNNNKPQPPTPQSATQKPAQKQTFTQQALENAVKSFFKKVTVHNYDNQSAYKELMRLAIEENNGRNNEMVEYNVNNNVNSVNNTNPADNTHPVNNTPSGEKNLGSVPEVPPTPERPRGDKRNDRLIQEIKAREKLENDFKTVKNERDILKKELEYMFNVNNELNTEKAKLEQNVNILNNNNSNLERQLEHQRNQYSKLSERNEELKLEASQYQSALGDAKNYRLGDNDANNPTQLAKVIEEIQDKINEFCKVKGGIEINERQLVLLLDKYKSISEPGDKVLAKAGLQRFIFETIVSRTDEYLKIQTKEVSDRSHNKVKEPYIELDIVNSTDEYLLKLSSFINSRDGTDKVSIEAPKKIRQLVYAVLGDRGFGLNKDKREHEFIQKLKDEIIKTMDTFRTIKKADKKKESEDMIAEIIRDVIKMFFFRIKVLEPPGVYEWIPKDCKIDPTLMEVGNLEDDNYEDWVVNLCNFPLISVKTGTERKVLAPAKIQAIKAGKKSGIKRTSMMGSQQR